MLEELLKLISQDKGGDPNLYKDLLDNIAYHESAHTMDPTIKQYGGGPGRGKYQFEGVDGSNRILTSAVRTKNYYRHKGLEVPKFIQSIINKGTEDASKLTSEQQDILAIGDLRMKGGLDLSDYAAGNLSIQDLWADHWWAGSKKERSKKIEAFNNSYYKKNPNKKKYNWEAYREKMGPSFMDSLIEAKKNNLQDIALNENQFNQGGMLLDEQYLSNLQKSKLNEFNTGGLHEENPHGGIPQGIGNNGKMNTVEEGETSFELDLGKYIFSNRLKIK